MSPSRRRRRRSLRVETIEKYLEVDNVDCSCIGSPLSLHDQSDARRVSRERLSDETGDDRTPVSSLVRRVHHLGSHRRTRRRQVGNEASHHLRSLHRRSRGFFACAVVSACVFARETDVTASAVVRHYRY